MTSERPAASDASSDSGQTRNRSFFLSLGPIAVIFVGGAIGTIIRALLESGVPSPPTVWPWTTFTINLVGSFTLGFVLESLGRLGPDEGWRRTVRLGLGTGVIGGFTTYCTFVVEVVSLADGGRMWLALAYALVSVVLGVLAAAIGIAVARIVLPRSSAPGASR